MMMQQNNRLAELLRNNSSWIRAISWQIYRSGAVSGVELDDYIHFGSIGFIEAISAQIELEPLSFKAYAYLRVRGHILNNIFRFSEIGAQLSTQYSMLRERSLALATAAEFPTEQSQQLSRLNELVVSAAIAVVLAEMGEDEAPISSSCPYYQLEQKQIGNTLREMISLLSKQEQLVIQLHYFQCLKFSDIAEVLSLSRARVSQIHAQAIRRIRELVDFQFSGVF